MSNLHFNIDNSLGKKLYDIAIEKIIVNHKVDDAINVLTTALIGLSKEYAIGIITGKYYLVVENGDMNLVTPDKISEHDRYKLTDIYNYLKLKTNKYESYLITKIKSIQSYFDIHTPTSYSRELFKIYITNDYIKQETIDDDSIYELAIICSGVKQAINEIASFTHFLYDIKQLDIDVSKLSKLLTNSINNMNLLIDKIINNTNNEIFTEVEITDKYDAGWLSPDGKFYGMNGHINDMLHLQLADLIIKNGIEKADGENNDWTLEMLGYVKIHHDWILFSAAAFCKKELTDEQTEQIIRYGNACYGQKLFFGDSKTFCSTAKFSTMDSIQRKNLF